MLILEADFDQRGQLFEFMQAFRVAALSCPANSLSFAAVSKKNNK